MGERNYIFLENDNIYLYSHWDTEKDLIKILRNALKRGRERWNDRQYLNRIIFSEMIKDDVLSLTGYGLSSDLHDGQIVLSVDVNNMTVNKIPFDKFIKQNEE